MFTLHTRIALLHLPLTPEAQRRFYTGDVLLSSDLIRSGPVFRRQHSAFLPRPNYPLRVEDYKYPPPGDMIERWPRVEPFKFTPDNIKLAAEWHGGQHTMLYALSSTGNLTPGSVRPGWCRCTADHYYSLYDSLKWELNDIIKTHPAHSDMPDIKLLHGRLNLYLQRIEPRLSLNYTQ